MRRESLQAMGKFNRIVGTIFQRKKVVLKTSAGNYEKLVHSDERVLQFRFLNRVLEAAIVDVEGKRVLDGVRDGYQFDAASLFGS